MDPKLSNLDPKLQDAYNRVMSNDSSGQPSQNPQPSAPQEPASEPTMPPPTDPDPNLNPTPLSSPEQVTPPEPTATQDTNPTLAPFPVTETPTPPVQQPQNMDPAPQPETTQPPAPEQTVKVNEAPTEQVPIQTPMPSPAVTSTVAFNASDRSKNVGTSPIKNGGIGSMLPVFVGIGIIFLLVAYTFVWIVIFNFEVPIISEFL